MITYPPVRQDLALTVAEEVAAGDLVAAAREAAGEELREARIFDVYRGEQVGEGKKSVALSLVFQSAERTLSDEEAGGLRGEDRRRARRTVRRRAAGRVNPILEIGQYCVSECAPALVTLAAVVALALSAGAGAQGTTTLSGTVGPGFTIRLVDGSGNSVRHLDPGSYTINVVDKSPEHNFHLTGPGVDKATEIEATVEETGTLTWNVTFQDGRYHFQCDAHANTIFGDFAVGSATLPPTTTTSTRRPRRPRPRGSPARSGRASASRSRAPAPRSGRHAQGRRGRPRRPRPLGDRQLPPHRSRREQDDHEGRQGHLHLEAGAEGRALPLPLGRDRDSEGLVPGHVTPRSRSSSAFSSAPKSSATAE